MLRQPRIALASVVLVLTALAALALDAFQLGDRSLWYDEAASISYAALSPAQLLAAIHLNDAFFALYYAVMHLWLSWSQSEAALRSFSIACALAALVAIALLARRLGGVRAAVAAAILAAANPFALGLAREGRPYALLVLCSTLATIAFLQAVERPRARSWVLYAVVASIACYVHVMGFLVVVVHAAWLTVCRPMLWRRGFAYAALGVALSLTPLLAVVHGYALPINGYLPRPTARDLVDTLRMFAGSWKLAALSLAIVAAAVATMRRAGRRERETATLIAFWLLLPPLLIFAVSQIKPVFLIRYTAEAWPAFVLAVALALARLPRVATALGLLAIAILSVAPIRAEYANVKEDWRGATAFVLSNARRDDGVAIFPANLEIAYGYYERRLPYRRARVVYPVRDPFPLLQERFPRNESLPAGVNARRLWVIIDSWAPDPEATTDARHFLASVPPEYRLAGRYRFTHITVLLFRSASLTRSGA